jgi:hypothetical protein
MSRWYYTLDNRQRLGPVTSEELRELALSGTIRPECMVTLAGVGRWVAAAKVKGLFPEPALSASSPVATILFPCPKCNRGIPLQQHELPVVIECAQCGTQFVPSQKMARTPVSSALLEEPAPLGLARDPEPPGQTDGLLENVGFALSPISSSPAAVPVAIAVPVGKAKRPESSKSRLRWVIFSSVVGLALICVIASVSIVANRSHSEPLIGIWQDRPTNQTLLQGDAKASIGFMAFRADGTYAAWNVYGNGREAESFHGDWRWFNGDTIEISVYAPGGHYLATDHHKVDFVSRDEMVLRGRLHNPFRHWLS